MTSNFNLFYYTSKSCYDCCEAFNTDDSGMMSDSQRSQKCKREYQCICWSLCITFYLVYCPYRCPKHYIMKCKNTGQSQLLQYNHHLDKLKFFNYIFLL